MKEMHWSWNDLMEIPESIYASMGRIMSIEAKEREKESKRGKSAGNKLGSQRHR
jgi:hypothetical protein